MITIILTQLYDCMIGVRPRYSDTHSVSLYCSMTPAPVNTKALLRLLALSSVCLEFHKNIDSNLM